MGSFIQVNSVLTVLPSGYIVVPEPFAVFPQKSKHTKGGAHGLPSPFPAGADVPLEQSTRLPGRGACDQPDPRISGRCRKLNRIKMKVRISNHAGP